MVCSFLNKKTTVIADKMWDFHWDLGESSGEWEQSCDRSSLRFEPMVSELQSLPGNFDHWIPMIQFMYYVVTIQIGISALWVLAKFSWIPWDPKPLTITITYCTRSQKTETQKSEVICPGPQWVFIVVKDRNVTLFSFPVFYVHRASVRLRSPRIKLQTRLRPQHWLCHWFGDDSSLGLRFLIGKNFQFNILGLKECAAASRANWS